MTQEEQRNRVSQLISRCVVHGAEELKEMLGLNQKQSETASGDRAARQVHFFPKRPKYINND